MTDDAWYVDTPAGPVGPLTLAQLTELANQGRLEPTHRVSRNKRSWRPAAEVPGLSFPTSWADTVPGPGASPAGTESRTAVSTDLVGDDGDDTTRPQPGIAPGARFGGYQILDVLGRGAMGVVYRASQPALARIVALKTVRLADATDAVATARFEREAQAVARLRHPNIVTAYDCGKHAGHVYFTMELLDGETLHDRLAREKWLPEALAWQVVRQAAAGLAHAASAGVIHRDVKPGNLFLTPPPTGYPLPPGVPMVKVTDFGLARLHEATPADHHLSGVGAVMGTPAYMAPEQFAGSNVDHRADIYALGVTAYEAIVGRPPYSSGNLLDLAQLKTTGALPTSERLSAASHALIAAMTAADPAGRPASYDHLLSHIDALLAGETQPPVSRPPVQPPAGRSRRWLLVPLAVALALAAWAAWALWPKPSPTPPPAAVVDHHRLFDGRSMAGWQPLRGEWTPTADAEGGRVLAGRGAIRRPLPAVDALRLTLGLDLHEASAVELHVGVAPDGSRLVLRVERDGGVTFGRRADATAAFVPLGPTQEFAAPRSSPAYVELKAERHGSYWWVAFDGQWRGSADAVGSLPEFWLTADGGRAHFEGFEALELR